MMRVLQEGSLLERVEGAGGWGTVMEQVGALGWKCLNLRRRPLSLSLFHSFSRDEWLQLEGLGVYRGEHVGWYRLGLP